MAHCFPWLQESSILYFTFDFNPYPLFVFPSPSPTTGHVSNVFGIYFFNGTTPTLFPYILPISSIQSPGLLPILLSDHTLMPVLAPQFTCPSGPSFTTSFPLFPAGLNVATTMISNFYPGLRAVALQQGQPWLGRPLTPQNLPPGNLHILLTKIITRTLIVIVIAHTPNSVRE